MALYLDINTATYKIQRSGPGATATRELMDMTLDQPMMYRFTCPEHKDSCPNNKDWILKSCEVLPMDNQTSGAEILAKKNVVTGIQLDGNSFMLPMADHMWTGDCYFGEASATGVVRTPTFDECAALKDPTNIMARTKGWKFKRVVQSAEERRHDSSATASGAGRRLGIYSWAVSAMYAKIKFFTRSLIRPPSTANQLWDAASDVYSKDVCTNSVSPGWSPSYNLLATKYPERYADSCKVLQTCQLGQTYGNLTEKTNVPHYSGKIRPATEAGEVTADNSKAQFQMKCNIYSFDGDATTPGTWSDCNLVLAFAGSDDIGDWVQNAQAWPSEASTRTGKKYHNGFKEHMDSLFNCVEYYREMLLQENHEVDYIVGHSLGGAAATIYAQESYLGNAKRGTATFGAPKTNVDTAAVKGYR